MEERVISVKELAAITELAPQTMYKYVGSYKFADYRIKQKINNWTVEGYIFNKKFAYALCDFLRTMRRHSAVERWIEYCDEQENWQ